MVDLIRTELREMNEIIVRLNLMFDQVAAELKAGAVGDRLRFLKKIRRQILATHEAARYEAADLISRLTPTRATLTN